MKEFNKTKLEALIGYPQHVSRWAKSKQGRIFPKELNDSDNKTLHEAGVSDYNFQPHLKTPRTQAAQSFLGRVLKPTLSIPSAQSLGYYDSAYVDSQEGHTSRDRVDVNTSPS